MVSTKLITIDELEHAPALEGRYELIEGELVEMSPAGAPHGETGMTLGVQLWLSVNQQNLGKVYGPDTGFAPFPGQETVRVPDVGFVSHDRLPPPDEQKGFLRLAPDLVVEVISPSDRRSEIAAKVDMWLEAGVLLLWLVDPDARTVSVYHPGQPVRLLHEDDVLGGEDVIPGFSLRVGEIFP